jgi:hypothetical protein
MNRGELRRGGTAIFILAIAIAIVAALSTAAKTPTAQPVLTNMPPQWLGESTKFSTPANQHLVLDLNLLFKDPEGQQLTFIATQSENLVVDVNDNILTITPEPGFTGERMVAVVASDGTQIASKRLKIEVGGTETQPEQPSEEQIPVFATQESSGASVDPAVEDALKKDSEVKVIIILKNSMPAYAVNSKQERKQVLESIRSAVKDLRQQIIGRFSASSAGIHVLRQYDTLGAIGATLTQEGLDVLKSSPLVDSIILNRKFTADLSDSTQIIGANAVWGMITPNGTNNTGVGEAICILDTGADLNHSAFANKIVSGYDFINSDDSPQDDSYNSHGTHTAGIAAANASFVMGVAPDANIVVAKVCDAGNSCDGMAILAGIDYCINNSETYGITAISGSLGDNTEYNSTTCPDWFDSLFAVSNSLGIIPVFASGNNGFTNGINYPACSPEVISVGSSSKSDTHDGFSNRGDGMPDVLAPGSSITSTVIGGGTGSLSGTSMATPHVSGAIALIQQNEKSRGRPIISLSGMRTLLQTTGVDVSGYSRIDVLEAVQQRNSNGTIGTMADCSGCGDCTTCANTPGTTCTITADISAGTSCINVNADNVTIDCNGKRITYSTGAGSYDSAIRAFNRANVTVRNCIIVGGSASSQFNTAINFTNTNFSRITNNVILANASQYSNAVLIEKGQGNVVADNNITAYYSSTHTNAIYVYDHSHQNNITGNNIYTNASQYNYGIYIDSYCNETRIENNNITTVGPISYSIGIYNYYYSNSPRIAGNTVFAKCTQFCQGIVLYSDSDHSAVENNTITTGGTANANYGIYLYSSTDYNNITNNTILTNGSSANYGINAYYSVSNRIYLNRITSGAALTPGSAEGIHLDQAINFSIYNNQITTTGNGNGYGINVYDSSKYNNITNNTIITGTNGSNNHGIYSNVLSAVSDITGNRITTYGNTSHGIFLTAKSDNNTIANNSITATGNMSYGIALYRANNTAFSNNILNQSSQWINSTESYNNFTNTTFINADGSINIPQLAQINSSEEITQQKLNVTEFRAFLNSTNLTVLNTSAIITINGVTGLNPEPVVDWDDDSGYEPCPTDVCTELSYTTGVEYIFNVTHFTQYTTNDAGVFNGSGAVEINTSTNLTGNITTNGTGIIINNNSLVLDCKGNTIYFGLNGSSNAYGIHVSGKTNVSIMFCNIVYNSTNPASVVGVLLDNVVNNSYFSDSNITIYGVENSTGLLFTNGTNNTIAGMNNINVFCTGGLCKGVYVNSSGNGVYMSRINVSSGYAGDGLHVHANRNQFSMNTIYYNGTSGFGLDTDAGSYINHTWTNVFMSGGSGAGVICDGGSDINLRETNITIMPGSTAKGIEISNNAVHVVFNTTRINGTRTWIDCADCGFTANFSNTTFITESGSINLPYSFNITSTTITAQKLNITYAKAFLNSTNLSALNQTGHIALYGITFTSPIPMVDWNDDGSFENCPETVCTEISYWPGMQKYLFNVAHFTTFDAEENVSIESCPVTINRSTTLTQNLMSPGSCITIGNDSVTLDCNGYRINYDGAGGTGNHGVSAVGRNGIAVRNCIINDSSMVGSGDYGVYFGSTNNSLIQGNTIITNGTNECVGIFLNDTNNVNASGNTITTSGSSGNGINIFNSTNTLAIGNIINTNESSMFKDGIFVFESQLSNITGNNIRSGGTSSNYGIEVRWSGNNTIHDNTIAAEGSSSYNRGIYLVNAAENTVKDNRIFSKGESGHAIMLDYSNHNTFISNNLSTMGMNSYGVFNLESNDSAFVATWFNFTTDWIYTSAISYNNFTNTTFDMYWGSINFPGLLQFNGSKNLSYQKLVITENFAYLDSAGYGFMNTTGIITLRGLSALAPVPTVSYNDIDFELCPADLCTELNRTASEYIFNVSHFTSFSTTDAYQNNITGCPVTINTTSTLANNISSNGTCIIFGNSSITLDCNGYTIDYGLDIPVGFGYGINATNKRNITIRNCNIISTISTGSNKYGIFLYNSSSSRVYNNNISTNGSSSNIGVYLYYANYTRIENNSIRANGELGSNRGLELRYSSYNITNNDIMTRGMSSNFGIYASNDESTSDQIITNNRINTSGDSANNHGISLTSMSLLQLTYNTIKTSGTYNNHGIMLLNNNYCNLLSNNITATGNGSRGIYIQGTSSANVINDNVINATGMGGTVGLYLENTLPSTPNNFSRNRIYAAGNLSYGMHIDSDKNIFTQLVLNDTTEWINHTGGISGVNFTNTTFETPEGSINFPGLIWLNNTANVIRQRLNISSNRAYMQTTSMRGFNSSGIITLKNLAASSPLPTADFNDDGDYESCPSSICTSLISTAGMIVFNVSHFTGYATSESVSGCPVTINQSAILAQNVSANATCITIGNDSVTLDCNGNTITLQNTSNYGVYALNRTNIAVRNCIIIDANETGSNSGIVFDSVNRSRISHNYVLINSSFGESGAGVLLYTELGGALSHNITISNNTFITTYSNDYGVYAYNEAFDNNITNNTFWQYEGKAVYIRDASAGNTIASNIIAQYMDANSSGIIVDNSNSTIIRNNHIEFGSTSSTSMGISLSSAWNSTILGNNLSSIRKFNPEGIVLQTGARNNRIENNSVVISAGQTAYGIIAGSSSNNSLVSNSVSIGGNITAAGIYLLSGSQNNTVYYNNITVKKSDAGVISLSSYGIYMRGGPGNSFESNNISVNGSANSYGVYFWTSNGNNTANYNTIDTNGEQGSNFGIFLSSESESNFTGNTISTNGASNNTGIRLFSSERNRFTGNNIITSGTGSHGIFIDSHSNSSIFNSTTLNNTVEWINVTADTANNFTNTAFAMPDGTITPVLFQLDGPEEVSKAKLNISANKAYLDSNLLPALNTTAIITLNNIVYADPKPRVDYEDDGSYVDCPAEQCTELSYSGNVYVYNVSHFTSYSSSDNFFQNLTGCATINESSRLTQNISFTAGTGACIVFGASDIELDCAGFTINRSALAANTMAIRAIDKRNVIVRNCRINRHSPGESEDFTGINFTRANYSQALNNTITFNITAGGIAPDFIGISAQGISNIIDSNTINTAISTVGTPTEGTGIIASGEKNNITNNAVSVVAMGATEAYGIGIHLPTQADMDNNTALNNYISITGNGVTRTGISIGANRVVLNNNTFTGTPISAIELGGGDNCTLNSTMLNMTGAWITSAAASLDNRFINTSFITNNGIINIIEQANLSGAMLVNTTNLNITANRAFLNTSDLFEFNKSAIITLYNINYIEPRPRVDWNDNGVYAPCTSDVCTALEYANNSYKFNVTHFTGYSTYEGAGINVTGCPIVLNSSAVLLNNLESNDTCITINASNVELLCNGHTINYSTNGSESVYGINAQYLSNITIRDCIFVLANTTSSYTDGIRLYRTNNSRIVNNTVLFNGTRNNKGINHYFDSHNNIIANNTITGNGTGPANTGIFATDQYNTSISHNRIRVDGNNLTKGIVSSLYGCMMEGNNITTSFGESTYGIYLSTTSNSTLTANRITESGSSGTGIFLFANSYTNNFTGNTIATAGNDNHGIGVLSNSNNNRFASNSISTSGLLSYGIYGQLSTGNLFNNTLLNNTSDWIYSDPTTNSVLEYTTFLRPDGSIYYNYMGLGGATFDISSDMLSISTLYAFANSSNITPLNSTATITLNGVTFIDPKPLVDWDDNGAYTDCPIDVCTEQSYSGGAYVFNVSHFTAYTLEENASTITSCGVTINESSAMGVNLTSNTTCLTLGADNITLNCNGNTIFYNVLGENESNGIKAENRTNVTIRNCIIRDINSSGERGYGIYARNVNSSLFESNTVITNGTGLDIGIFVYRGEGNTISQNTLIAGTSGQENSGVRMLFAANNTVTGNTIHTSGEAGGNYGISISSGSADNNVTANSINTSGAAGDNFGIALSNAHNNLAIGNNITTKGYLSHGLYLSGIGNRVNQTILNNTEGWVYSAFPGSNNVTNTTFMTSHGSINIPGTFEISDNTEATPENLNITYNRAFLNSTNLTYLNTTGIITLYNINHTSPLPSVDWNDTSAFVHCPPSVCTQISYSAGTYIYSVTHFTSFGSAWDSNITNSTIIDSNVTNSTIGGSNITNSSITNCTVINSTVIGSTKTNCTIIDSTIINSTNINTTIIDSNETNSTDENTYVVNASIINSIKINSTINNTVLNNSNVTNATLTNCTVTNSTIFNVVNSSCNYTNYIQPSPTPTPTPSPGGGGGGGGGYGGGVRWKRNLSATMPILPCTENWNCEEWGWCQDKKQSRVCVDLNSCGTATYEPATERACGEERILHEPLVEKQVEPEMPAQQPETQPKPAMPAVQPVSKMPTFLKQLTVCTALPVFIDGMLIVLAVLALVSLLMKPEQRAEKHWRITMDLGELISLGLLLWHYFACGEFLLLQTVSFIVIAVFVMALRLADTLKARRKALPEGMPESTAPVLPPEMPEEFAPAPEPEAVEEPEAPIEKQVRPVPEKKLASILPEIPELETIEPVKQSKKAAKAKIAKPRKETSDSELDAVLRSSGKTLAKVKKTLGKMKKSRK